MLLSPSLRQALDELGFQPPYSIHLLGRGNAGSAHHIRANNGEVVLKQLDTQGQGRFDPDEKADAIIENLRELTPRMNAVAVTPAVYIPGTEPWYLRTFAAGPTVEQVFCELTQAERRDIALAYGSMLASAHDAGIIIASHGWDDFVWNGTQGTLIDYESAATIESAQIPWHISRTIGHRYASREQLLANARIPVEDMPRMTIQVDVEAFARMIDHLYNETAIRNGYRDVGLAQEAAKRNSLIHPAERLTALPRSLQEPVHALCSYPRDDSITLDTLIEALTRVEP